MVVKPRGLLHHSQAEGMLAAVGDSLNHSETRLIIDLSKVQAVDSRGLEVLVELSGLLAKTGRLLEVCSANVTLLEVFDLTDVASLFQQHDDLDAALGSNG